MFFNLHTHTYRCNHASGTEKEYVEHAIANGIKVLGFSDHAPYIFPQNYYSGFRVPLESVGEYFKTIGKLRDEYKNDIKIYIGLEAEYYPKHFDDFLNLIRPYSPDYLILGQHFLNNEYDGPYSGNATDNTEILKLYVSQVIEALNRGCFTYLAHPDLINFTGDKKVYLQEMEKLCLVAKKLDIPLEINLLGVMEDRQYPRDDFFKLAAQIGNKAILGSDAHQPQNTYNKAVIDKAKAFSDKTGIEIIDSVKLRPIF